MTGSVEIKNEKKYYFYNLFSLLSKEGSYKILKTAGDNLTAKTGKWKDLGLSKRQYYSRLREMKKMNLIKKERENYVLTHLGNSIQKSVESLRKKVIPNSLSDDYDSSPRNKKEKRSEEISIEIIGIKNSYEEFINFLLSQMESTQEEFLFTTKHSDYRLKNSLMNTCREEFLIKGILPLDYFEKLREKTKQKVERNIQIDKKIEENTNIFEKCTKVSPNIPYSFFLKDKELIGLEISNPSHSSQFFLGIILKSKKMYQEFLNIFNSLYECSQSPSISRK